MRDPYFDELKKTYLAAGHRLYIVGGTSRDMLLARPYDDLDFVSDATVDESRLFLKDADFTFAKYGSLRVKVKDKRADVTTLREEGEYFDFRHPSHIKFVRSPEEDYSRRDFTINAIYIDEDYKIIDYVHGLDDLHKGLIRFIGDPYIRIKEDPLRILRAYRFEKVLGFKIEEKSLKAMEELSYLVDKLNKEKVAEEKRKAERK
ncbi:MAG: hypothetical protein LKF89_02490 [Bacilli bacterium]|jgi:tRNA nucleotidyltransferase/poly(A) polymerase|nr:hypothetical protein [Bacilli bacterium]